MKCEEFQSVMEEYVDGELDEQTTQLARAHLAACAACALLSEELWGEQEIYAHYQRDVTVTPALWQGVRSRIEVEKISHGRDLRRPFREWFAGSLGAPRFSPALTAAMVLIAVGITIGAMRYMNSRAETRQQVVAFLPGPINVPPSPEPSEIGTPAEIEDRKSVV